MNDNREALEEEFPLVLDVRDLDRGVSLFRAPDMAAVDRAEIENLQKMFKDLERHLVFANGHLRNSWFCDSISLLQIEHKTLLSPIFCKHSLVGVLFCFVAGYREIPEFLLGISVSTLFSHYLDSGFVVSDGSCALSL